MSPLLIKISKDFATLWTTIDPIGNVALFAGLTAALTRSERHLTALRAVIYATIILVAAGTVGQVILDAIGIHMHSLWLSPRAAVANQPSHKGYGESRGFGGPRIR